MAPKRKRGEESANGEITKAATSKGTRASTRLSKKTEEDESNSAAQGSELVTQPAKKTKVTRKSKETKASTKTSVVPQGDHNSRFPVTVSARKVDDGSVEPAISKGDAKAKAQEAPPKPEPYSPARADALYMTYADEDDTSFIGAEGFEKLCTDADIPMDGALPVLLAWQTNSTEMAKITKEQWMKGMGALEISSLPVLSTALNDLNDLLILSMPPVQTSSHPKSKKNPTGDVPDDPYNRSIYHKYARDTKAAFRDLYSFCFALAKPESSRNIEMEMAVALWSVILAPKYPIMGEIIQFITESGSYKGANKDLWNMMLEFCETISPNLDNYDENEGAWPTLLDEFVSWKRGKSGGSS